MTISELDKIVEDCPEQVQLVLRELHQNIREAAAVALEQSQETESGKAAVKVSLGLSIDLTTSPVSWQVDGAVSVRHKVVGEPMTADLTPEIEPGLGKGRKPKGVTIRSGDKEVRL